MTETFHECDACADFLLLTLHISIYGIRGYLCTLTWQKYSVVNLHKGCCRFVAFMLVRVLSALCIRLLLQLTFIMFEMLVSSQPVPLLVKTETLCARRNDRNLGLNIQIHTVLDNSLLTLVWLPCCCTKELHLFHDLLLLSYLQQCGAGGITGHIPL